MPFHCRFPTIRDILKKTLHFFRYNFTVTVPIA